MDGGCCRRSAQHTADARDVSWFGVFRAQLIKALKALHKIQSSVSIEEALKSQGTITGSRRKLFERLLALHPVSNATTAPSVFVLVWSAHCVAM
jgi:hypothetical protein